MIIVTRTQDDHCNEDTRLSLSLHKRIRIMMTQDDHDPPEASTGSGDEGLEAEKDAVEGTFGLANSGCNQEGRSRCS